MKGLKLAAIVIVDNDGDVVVVDDLTVMWALLDALNECPFKCE